jgi:hypothetical protein
MMQMHSVQMQQLGLLLGVQLVGLRAHEDISVEEMQQ